MPIKGKGLRCVDCGGDTCTVATRRRNGAIYRRRQCQACSVRFTTRELPEALLKRLEEQLESLRELAPGGDW